jgi:hypothetical protein
MNRARQQADFRLFQHPVKSAKGAARTAKRINL